MKAILIPVKEFAEAKKRLVVHFCPGDRAALARALCRDFFRVISQVRGVDRVFVVSKEGETLEAARRAGWEAIVETQQTSESASVDFASRYCAAQGVTALLRVPVDIPLAQPADIENLFDHLDSSPGAVIVPSGDGTGTNALLRTPPAIFPSRFGPNSLALHLAEAKAAGVSAQIVRNPRLELDLDELKDLERISALVPAGSATADWFAKHFSPIGLRANAATPAG